MTLKEIMKDKSSCIRWRQWLIADNAIYITRDRGVSYQHVGNPLYLPPAISPDLPITDAYSDWLLSFENGGFVSYSDIIPILGLNVERINVLLRDYANGDMSRAHLLLTELWMGVDFEPFIPCTDMREMLVLYRANHLTKPHTDSELLLSLFNDILSLIWVKVIKA